MPPRAATLPLLIVQGNWDEARELARLTRAQGSPLERQMAVTILGKLSHYQGNVGIAWEMVSELVPRGPDSEPEDGLFPYAIEMLRLAVSLALDASDFQGARDWLKAHDRWMDWSKAVRGRAESRLLWARLHQLEGYLTQAERYAQEARDLATDPRQPLSLLATYRFLGHISMDEQRYADAQTLFTQALSLADSCAAPYERARTLLKLADLYLMTSQVKHVSPLLEEIRNIAVELKAAPLITMADDLEAKRASGTPAFRLTTREIDILRLVAQGLTDAEVADRLYISPRTVGQHLRSIYNKLDVSSRTSATRLAIENHLV